MSYLFDNNIKKHKVFISFHHEDESYKNEFEKLFGEVLDGFVSKAVGDGDINTNIHTDTIRQKIRDEFIRDSTVTVVLIGNETWKRKHVDWEIGSSIRDTRFNPRNGLLGILLPSYSTYNTMLSVERKYTENGGPYNPKTIPPRLYKNVECGFAKIYSWPTSSENLKSWIHDAFVRRNKIHPDNSYPSFGANRNSTQKNWE